MIFVGYDEISKVYRCYNKSNGKLVVSRDVRFTANNQILPELLFTKNENQDKAKLKQKRK